MIDNRLRTDIDKNQNSLGVERDEITYFELLSVIWFSMYVHMLWMVEQTNHKV